MSSSFFCKVERTNGHPSGCMEKDILDNVKEVTDPQESLNKSLQRSLVKCISPKEGRSSITYDLMVKKHVCCLTSSVNEEFLLVCLGQALFLASLGRVGENKSSEMLSFFLEF